eukprot:6188715-Pleurochrysis_carterae.AAC.3
MMLSQSAKHGRGAGGLVRNRRVPPVNVLRALVVLRVVGKVDRQLVVHRHTWSAQTPAESPRSSNSDRTCAAFLATSHAAMISASQEDSATDGCFFDAQEIAARWYMKTYPDVILTLNVALLNQSLRNPSDTADSQRAKRSPTAL